MLYLNNDHVFSYFLSVYKKRKEIKFTFLDVVCVRKKR